MKTLFLSGAAIAVLGLAIAPVSGQTQSTSGATYIQSSKLVGTKVKSSQGEEIGVVKDVVLDRNTGCMAYTVLSTGGGGTRVSGGSKVVAVPWAVYSPTSDISELTVTVDRDRIYNAPVFDYARIDEYSRGDYINNVYSYYGVSAGAGAGAGVSTGATTTTGTAGAAGATGSPGGMASPAATGAVSPSGRARASPRATVGASPRETAARSPATESPSARGAATASPPTTGTRSERSRTGVAPSPRSGAETGSPPETRESPSRAGSPGETTTAPRHRGKQRTSETGTPPERPEEQE